MMMTRSLFFEPGARATIELEGQQEPYSSRIEDVVDDTLVLAAPMRGGDVIRLEQGQKILLSVMRRMNPYFFETTVVSNRAESTPLLVVKRPPDNTGVPKRQYIRVEVLIDPVQIWVEEDGKYGKTIRGMLLNISAGGCLLMARESIPEHANILLKFSLPLNFGQMMVNGETLRTWERVGDGGRTYRTSVSFRDVPDKDRDRVIKFVFQRERELRQKGVL
ncbi:MAG: flagellar brake domain-containing protein [Chloroflexi bacterium]|nr:flagellar brake domain-containing protein [Chloroflexota bacterium]